jgi:hypothetical protein
MKARTTRGFFNKTNAARTKKTEKAFRSLGYQMLRKSENQKKKERKEKKIQKRSDCRKVKPWRRVLLNTY